MMEYEIKNDPIVLKDGTYKDKYNVYYYVDGEFYTREFHSCDGINGTIRDGYSLKQNLIDKKSSLWSRIVSIFK